MGGRPVSLDQILRYAGLSDLKAELEQFAIDARGTPQRIVKRPKRTKVASEITPSYSDVQDAMELTPPELVDAHLKLDQQVTDALRETRAPVVPTLIQIVV